ncbi:MAG: hypothetical protein COS39_06010 [Hydrogenophilales bacterium CG03_land_8_20_14_0_80_62_28]|nr:hypothetical protein [Betaproteobacteria bacterium]PIV22872.1 MAG: hypothetical protein COS39_06010 [Hydrogenophilales bacterium CG03_land_8_20_14_0_80_62_28]PIW39365.1 MAG: hypothetical protein COW23_01725 [Hydrogenophilales bacterium CG15_BIG_FIL_POST_REV_8_21_14_020_62_31]PIW71617.1 MAG: hypothetical protein COW07_07325 [Hydrogenophilales bacterium CG12_big_fil_rev_8_21_14_0_65_61_21]PIX02713.1 MAG: hypothetical protein COZ79_00265 [Hydrogenophilales bacterium CG_4_8_14_3_um_filter_62_83]
MPSRTIGRTDNPDIAAQQATIAAIEKALWRDGLNEALLPDYQAAYRELERRIAARGEDRRYRFVIVVPVADRPRHLQSCLDSLLELCRLFGYGGQRDGRYLKVAVFIADDSRDEANISAHREIASQFSGQGLDTLYFGLREQIELLDSLSADERERLAGILGKATRESFAHKGSAVMRNIAFLKLNALFGNDDRLLFHAIDSDQEFKIKVGTAAGDKAVYGLSFFHALDAIFSQTDALALTGKVVGDPPVSPAVMASNFLDDVIDFLRQMAASGGHGPCGHHRAESRHEGEAAYHDMADLFGFKMTGEAYRYRCTLTGAHSDADCFDHFAHRLKRFFYGEHPTRISYYRYAGAVESVQPARTVYTGNYVFRPEALRYFIPFADLRLRMLGPSLGRVIRSEIGGRFVAANLPMLHKRTVEETGRSEFRPGIDARAEAIELCGEFERQFYGDVMLFALERLTAMGLLQQALADSVIAGTVETVHSEMLEKYAAKHRAIVAKLEQLDRLLHGPDQWWNQTPAQAKAVGEFADFSANMEHNFGADSPCYAHIRDHWPRWRAGLVRALVDYPQDRLLWAAVLAALP